jgi:hypothetical protein
MDKWKRSPNSLLWLYGSRKYQPSAMYDDLENAMELVNAFDNTSAKV